MKHIVLLFIALAICFSGTYGQRQKKPKIEFEQTLYNYDTILQGANGECLFIFKPKFNQQMQLLLKTRRKGREAS